MKKKTDLTYQQDTQTLIGEKKRTLCDIETNEIIEVNQITKRIYGQKAFWKVYLTDFMNVLGILDSKQLDILIYIAENTQPSTNTFLGTYKQIAKDVGCSQPTIAKVLKKLKEKGFIKSIQTGAYIVNPNILMKGDPTKQQILLQYYNSEEPIDAINKNKSGQKPLSILAKSTGTVKPVEDAESGQFELRETFINIEDGDENGETN